MAASSSVFSAPVCACARARTQRVPAGRPCVQSRPHPSLDVALNGKTPADGLKIDSSQVASFYGSCRSL